MNYRRISFIALLSLCTFIGDSFAQDKPAPSPTATFSQKVGLTDVTIVYSRPSKKGRTIMGELVPYGKVWRTGANATTKITFSDDVKISGKNLAAGKYAFWTIPGESEWTVIFSKDIKGGAGDYKESEDALRVNVEALKIDETVETFEIMIADNKPNFANIRILWESTLIHVPLEVK